MSTQRLKRLIAAACAACAVSSLSACPGAGENPRPAVVGPPPGLWHQAGDGESPADLARQYRVPLEDILEINGLEKDTRLSGGQVVFVPGAKPERPQVATKAAASRATGDAAGSAGGALLWPVPGGHVTSRFGLRGKQHEGIDIAAPEGTNVLCAADGKVIYSGSGVRGYGNLILIRHARGVVTVYAHNRRNLVREKDVVRGGQVIAEVGQTGNATATHLHFEVRRGEVPEDPLAHFPALR